MNFCSVGNVTVMQWCDAAALEPASGADQSLWHHALTHALITFLLTSDASQKKCSNKKVDAMQCVVPQGRVDRSAMVQEWKISHNGCQG